MEKFQTAIEQHTLEADNQRQDEKFRTNVRQQVQIDHALARVHSSFANDLARGQGGAEPNGNQRQHEVWKIAWALCADNKVGQKSDDRRLDKQNQQIEF